jgi:hypothetical protein
MNHRDTEAQRKNLSGRVTLLKFKPQRHEDHQDAVSTWEERRKTPILIYFFAPPKAALFTLV